MNILAIESSSAVCSVAVVRDETVLAERVLHRGSWQGVALASAVADCCAAAGVALPELDCIAAGLGPGSFTGLRIGVTAAKTLAMALAKPVVGIPSFTVLAAPIEGRPVTIVTNAYTGRIFVGRFAAHAAGVVPQGEIRVMSAADRAGLAMAPDEIVLTDMDESALAIPPGADIRRGEAAVPAARVLGRLARIEWRRRGGDALHALSPLYLRKASADEQWEAAGKR